MSKLGSRVRLKGTHIVGDVQEKEMIGGMVMCRVWWDVAPNPDKKFTHIEELESAEKMPAHRDSRLYDPEPISKSDRLRADRKWREGHERS